MLLVNNKLLKYFSSLTILIFVLSILLTNLSGLGGYNINDNLSIADRYIKTGNYFYTAGEADNYSATPAYFPGFSFLIILIQKFIKIHIIEVISIISGAFILTFLFLIYKTSIILGANKNFTKIIIPLFATLFYPAWLWYAIDFKPDTFLISLFILALIIINSNLNVSLKTIIVFLVTFLGTITKQQFISLFISIIYALYLYEEALLNKKVLWICLAAILGLVVIFSIDNLYLIKWCDLDYDEVTWEK
jgi:hypothetical protein